ncbi:hypothetical protein HK100_009127 [Physocladia obscura]|uniref:Uncharacterized protein n=1 Tax=Physocladia obscura TaxID=109957 RepID=A0AAD5XFA1_9FUNG|nr:hypothetical protein HK100_009127 [Physocladia obscura]
MIVIGDKIIISDYLLSEIDLIKTGGSVLASDPMLASLSKTELDRVVVQSILAMGAISVPQQAFTIIQDLIKFLNSDDHDMRYSAFVSITNQVRHLDSIEQTSLQWVVLPLYADPHKPLRVAFAKFLRNLPSRLDNMVKVILPHSDDGFVMNSITWEDSLMDGASLHVNMKILREIGVDFNSLNSLNTDLTDNLPEQDDGFNLPRISQKLMARFKEIARGYTTLLPAVHISQVMFHLLEMQASKHAQGYSLLVLSEFCCLYESILNDSIDIMVSSLSQDFTPENTNLIQAAALGLKNISEISPPAFKQMLTKITGTATPSEGELFNLYYRIDAIRDFSANKAPELLKKYSPIVTSSRFSITKRLYAIYLSVELCLIVGPEEIMHVLDAMQVFIESSNDDEAVEKIHGSISKLLGVVGPRHAIFRTMLGTCRKHVKSKDTKLRKKSLQIFQIFIKHLPPQEAMGFGMTFLADSNPEIRSKSRQILIISGLLDFAISSLKNAKSYVGTRRGALLETGKLPSLNKLGVSLASDDENSFKLAVPLAKNDPFNVKYYTSDRRKKLTNRYGLDETKFTRTCVPVTPSILEVVEESVRAFHQAVLGAMEHYQWMFSIDTTSLLHECMKEFPEVAEQVINSHLTQIESSVGIKNSDNDEEFNEVVAIDVENEIHVLEVFSNLLIAYDGIKSENSVKYIKRLQNFVTSCNEKAEEIRESLYSELESSFYFFNEFIDVPIVSEEQYEALEFLKAENQKATLEAVKSGTTERLTALDMKKVAMDDMLESKSESLRRFTILTLQATSSYGVYHALSLDCSESNIIDSLQFISDMLQNEHRGIRIAAVEAFLTVSKIQLENQDRPDILHKIQDTVTFYFEKLIDKSEIFRRKADYINLVSQLLVYFNDSNVVIKVLSLLVKFWKDPDNEVRIISIKMVRLLGEMGIPQVMECFKTDEKTTLSFKDGRPDLNQALSSLLGNPDYLEKEGLQELLTWRFLH